MGLLYPGALIFFVIVPVLVLAYLARERPSRVTVSSVLAFRALRGLRKERFGGRPRFDWMFLVELFLLSLAVIAMAGPYIIRRSSPIAVVIDNSAAMQAKLETGATRFEEAIDKVERKLASTDDNGKITIFSTAPAPHRIAPPFDSIAEALIALRRLQPSDAPNDGNSVAALLSALTSEGRFSKVIFAGSQAIAPPVPASIDSILVDDAIPNLALGSFGLRREIFGEEALHAQLTVANFSSQSKPVEVVIEGDGRKLGDAHETLAAGETGSLEFPALPPARSYSATLNPDDAFPLDNVAYATGGSVKAVAILFISPTPGDGAGLDSIPGVAVKTVAPGSFSPEEFKNADLAIFEYAAPKELPAVNTLMVMPPPGDPVFDFSVTSAAGIQIAGWRNTDQLTDSVNFRMLNFGQGEFLGAHPWMSSVVSGQGGGLLMRGERQGHRYVATGFNPFPYLGRRNLPMSILTLNILSYLAGLGANSGGYHTGEPWLVPAGVETVTLPSGKKIKATPGTLFTEVGAQGIYELSGPDVPPTPRAVNLDNMAVSDFQNTPQLKVETRSSSTSGQWFIEKASVSAWVLMAILALGALEAIIVYRRRRRPLEA
ncbi:MAG: vWA domain-containing protein [Candidatus Binataceae bacterium]